VATGEAGAASGRTLYVVATPLGNLRDISLRALDILAGVDIIAAEDTRVSAKLLARHGIASRLLSVHDHNERRRAGEIVRLLGDAGVAVVPVPGPSAVIAALSASGIAAPRWLFCGFLPASASARRKELERLRDCPCALVFYEAPHRIAATLDALAAGFGAEREVVVARELTKQFESIHRCRLGEAPAWLAADADRSRGEFVVIVDAPVAAPRTDQVDAAHDRTLAVLLSELPLAQAVRIAVALTGAPRKRLYARALAHSAGGVR
jgi:16S rRNA (cytidine1402-2'-O)-methyltransferase